MMKTSTKRETVTIKNGGVNVVYERDESGKMLHSAAIRIKGGFCGDTNFAVIRDDIRTLIETLRMMEEDL